MDLKRIIRFLSIVVVLMSAACTENPLFKEKISSDPQRTIRGVVTLQNEVNNAGIVVYLEQYDMFVETGTDGSYTFTLPRPHIQAEERFTGLLRIYYYVANYRLDYSTVLVHEGEFVFDIIDLNEEGVVQKKSLTKILDISTAVFPTIIEENYDGDVFVEIHANAFLDSVEISTILKKGPELGSIFLYSPEKTHVVTITDDIPRSFKITGTTIFSMQFNWAAKKAQIPGGIYDVIPWLKVIQKDIPPALLSYFGKAVDYNRTFLNTPYRRTLAKIQIHK